MCNRAALAVELRPLPRLDSLVGRDNYSRLMTIEYDPKADYYQVLGIDVDATAADIKRAHRARIRKQHPDRGGDPGRAAVLNIARDVLTEPNTRSEYDQARLAWLEHARRNPFVRMFLDPEAYAAEYRAETAKRAEPADPRERARAGASRPSPPHAEPAEKQAPKWRWWIVSEFAWEDIAKVLWSGDVLGAVGLLGAALFVDRAIQQSADPDQLAAVEALTAERQRERLRSLVEALAGRFGIQAGGATAPPARAGGRSATTAAASATPSTGTPKRRRTRVRNAGVRRARRSGKH